MIYILIFLLLLYCIIRYDINKEYRGCKNWAVILSLILISIFAFRYRMGTDSVSYEYFFEKLLPTIDKLDFKHLTEDYKYEPGFVVTCSLIKTIFGNNYYVLQILSCIIIFGVLFKYLYHKSNHFFLSLSLFVILYGFSICDIIRQSLAMSIAICALSYLEKSNYLKYYLLLAFAFTFHYSSAIFVILPFLRKCRVNNVTSYVFLLFLFVVGGTLRIQFGGIIELAGNFFVGFDRASIYGEGSRYMNDEINFNAMTVSLFWILTYILISSRTKEDVRLKPYNYLLFYFLCWQVLSINLGIFYRFSTYFYFIGVMYLAEGFFVLRKCKNNKNVLAIIMTVITVALIFKHSIQIEVFPGAKQIECYYPYNSIFEQEPMPRREAIYNQLP